MQGEFGEEHRLQTIYELDAAAAALDQNLLETGFSSCLPQYAKYTTKHFGLRLIQIDTSSIVCEQSFWQRATGRKLIQLTQRKLCSSLYFFNCFQLKYPQTNQTHF